MPAFDEVADAYDAARPAYPDGLYDALEALVGPLRGRLVLDGGAGTGIATRALTVRGARVVAVDIAVDMLRRAVDRDPAALAVASDGNRLPLRRGTVDVACFAQSWHWLDPSRAVPELVRVLAPDGWWSGWWSHPRADGEAWFDAYQDAVERTCPAYDRRQRDTDWSRAIVASGAFGGRASFSRVSWTRQLTLATWLLDETSKSYVAALNPEARDGLLARIETILAGRFPDRELRMPYETWIWTARRTAA